MDFYFEEEMKYKKKARPKQNKRANHKHLYTPCVIEYPSNWYNSSIYPFDKMISEIKAYCPVCMKLTSLGKEDYHKYYIHRFNSEHGFIYCLRPTEEGARELNRDTRTLPSFYVNSPFDKFIEVEVE